MLKNTDQTYGLVAQALHWATAILILTLIPLGIYMHDLPVTTEAEIADKSWLYSLHKTLGVLVFIIATVRVGWAIIQPHPIALNAHRKLESLLAETIHWTLYVSIIAMPLSGWLHHSALEGFAPVWGPLPDKLPFVPKDAGVAEIFANAHFFIGVVLIGSLVLHISGALKHALIDKDGTVARMVPGKYKADSELSRPDRKSPVPIFLAASTFAAVAGLSLAWTNHAPVTAIQNAQSAAGNQQTKAPDASVTAWTINHEKSTLAISVAQAGSELKGEFGKWSADVRFDPDKLSASSVEVTIDIASLTLGGVTSQALSEAFLNVAIHPKATYRADNFSSTGDGKYKAAGELTLLGQGKPLDVDFDLKIDGNKATMTGKSTIKRLDYGVGASGFSTDDMVGFNVEVIINIEANKADEKDPNS